MSTTEVTYADLDEIRLSELSGVVHSTERMRFARAEIKVEVGFADEPTRARVKIAYEQWGSANPEDPEDVPIPTFTGAVAVDVTATDGVEFDDSLAGGQALTQLTWAHLYAYLSDHARRLGARQILMSPDPHEAGEPKLPDHADASDR